MTTTETTPAAKPKNATKKTTAPKRPPRSRGGAAGLVKTIAGPVGEDASAAVGAIAELPLDAIAPDHFENPRGPIDVSGEAFRTLVETVREQGVLQSLLVGHPLLDGRYPLVAGNRRYAAARAAGLATVPVRVGVDIRDAADALEAALVENFARDDMDPLAEARGLRTLIAERGYTQVEAGKRLGRSERTVRNRLALLDVDEVAPEVAEGLAAGVVPSRAASWVSQLTMLTPDAGRKLVAAAAKDDKLAATLTSGGDEVKNAIAGAAVVLDHGTPLSYATRGYKLDDVPLTPGVRDELAPRFTAAQPPKHRPWEWVGEIRFTVEQAEDALAKGAAVRAPNGHVYAGASPWLDHATRDAVEAIEKRKDAFERQRAARDAKAAKPSDAEQRAAEERKARAARMNAAATAMNQRLGEVVADALRDAAAEDLLDLVVLADPELAHDADVSAYDLAAASAIAACTGQTLDQVCESWPARYHAAGGALERARCAAWGVLLDELYDPRHTGPFRPVATTVPRAVDAIANTLGLYCSVPRLREFVVARQEYADACDHERQEPRLRRVLVEARDRALTLDELIAACGERKFGEVGHGAAGFVGHENVEDALTTAAAQGLLKQDRTQRWKTTAAGVKRLDAPMPDATFPDIDAPEEATT